MAIDVPFVDRGGELEALVRLVERGTYIPVFLYGPEGCGKTRLLQELVARWRGDAILVYIDAVEEERVNRAVLVGGASIAADALAALASIHPVGRVLATRIQSLVEAIAARLALRGRRLALLIDDVTSALGVERIEWYLKYLQSLAETLAARYNLESIAVVATTSEGVSFERVSRHTYARPRLIWNLDEKAAIELAETLGADATTAENLYLVTGGNPRAIIDVAVSHGWRIDEWVEDVRLTRVEPAAAELMARGLTREALLLAEDPDALREEPDEKLMEAYRILLQRNLVMYKGAPLLHGGRLKPEPELGIGEYYAWQMPVYRKLVQEALRG